ncbi:hypothetical protein OG426_10050 [Streptomyces canus]|uniref:FeoB-associated Cys-rich membrane protein n=1 Tax=Streptomyces canus TaxID=58343 RepID=UPI00386D10B1|nr:hypothetical protein OG426_10050 [Streptomyces canus]
MLTVLVGGAIAVAAQYLIRRIVNSSRRQKSLKHRCAEVLSTLEAYSDATRSAILASGEYSWDQRQYIEAVKALKRRRPPKKILQRLSNADRRRIEVETIWASTSPETRRSDQALHKSLLSYESTVESFAVEASIFIRLFVA